MQRLHLLLLLHHAEGARTTQLAGHGGAVVEGQHAAGRRLPRGGRTQRLVRRAAVLLHGPAGSDHGIRGATGVMAIAARRAGPRRDPNEVVARMEQSNEERRLRLEGFECVRTYTAGNEARRRHGGVPLRCAGAQGVPHPAAQRIEAGAVDGDRAADGGGDRPTASQIARS